MTSFAHALAALDADGAYVAAWDHDDASRTRMVLYAVTAAGATALADTAVPLEGHGAHLEQLRTRGVRIGSCHAGTLFVWAIDEHGASVWTNTARVAHVVTPPPGVEAVHVFYDRADRGHRGVRFVLRGGGHQLVAEQHDPAARLDLTYGEANLSEDARWARALAEQLAVWCLVPLVDDIFAAAFDADLTIARAARQLAGELEGSDPQLGSVASMGPIGRSSALAFALMPDPLGCALELRVASPGGQTTTARVLARGEVRAVAAFLRGVTTPATVQFAMNDVIRAQKRDGAA